MTYDDFLKSKAISDKATGIPDVPEIHSALYPFQADIVRWALRRGRAACWEDCGIGKTIQQLEWCRHVAAWTKQPVLLLAPPGVREQSAKEAENKLGLSVTMCDADSDVRDGVNITNYQKLHKFDPRRFSGVALDEAGILKSMDGVYRTALIEAFASTPFRSEWTATPSPNDYMEIGNHAEFLGVMSRTEMLSMFFVHDGGETSKWRLKGHAQADFWKWVCSWAVFIRKPSDLGYPDDGFILPPLNIRELVVESKVKSAETLFAMPASTMEERRDARRNSIAERCAAAADLILKSEEQFLVWCGLNAEQEEMERLLGDKCVSIQGSTPEEDRVEMSNRWIRGEVQSQITKGSIFGFGMNYQHCRNEIFVGLNDSQELFYQEVRRCWRFGQKREVNCWIITSSAEGNVVQNIKRKEADAQHMAEEMVSHMKDISTQEIRGLEREKSTYKRKSVVGKSWKIELGDCVESIRDIENESVHFSVFSPPFSQLYCYSNSDRDMGNCKDDDEFFAHFSFLPPEILRITKPGRLCAFHCMNLPTSKSRDGVIGIRDFRGDLIRAFTGAGWIYHSEVCIWKDPVTAMQRTKALGLLHKQLKKDSCMSRQGIPDYLVVMRKPGDNPERVTHTNETFPVSVWQQYASPIWMDIRPNDTLQKESAREHNDEKHICPLQIQVISRAIDLWTNPGDLVYSPFTGIGSEGYVAVKKGRRFVGAELKESYFNQAVANLTSAEKEKPQNTFDFIS